MWQIETRSASNKGAPLNYRAIIFDLDGTLLDTLTDIAMAANDVLQSLGETAHPIADYRFMVGDGVLVLFQRALPATREDHDLLQECVHLFEKFYAIRWKETSAPYPEIPELLDWLTEENVPMTVLSNKPHPFTCQCVEELLPKWSFQVVLGQRPEIPRKPDPAGVYELLGRLGSLHDSTFEASEVLYVGDTNTDMQTAVASGCFPIGVTWGFRPEMELRQAGASTIIHHPIELQSLFTK